MKVILMFSFYYRIQKNKRKKKEKKKKKTKFKLFICKIDRGGLEKQKNF